MVSGEMGECCRRIVVDRVQGFFHLYAFREKKTGATRAKTGKKPSPLRGKPLDAPFGAFPKVPGGFRRGLGPEAFGRGRGNPDAHGLGAGAGGPVKPLRPGAKSLSDPGDRLPALRTFGLRGAEARVHDVAPAPGPFKNLEDPFAPDAGSGHGGLMAAPSKVLILR